MKPLDPWPCTPPLPAALLCALTGLLSAALPAAADGPPGSPAAPRELTAKEQALELRVWELVDLAADGVPREEVLERLGRIAAARLAHQDWRVREQALVALGPWVDPDSLPAQIALLEDQHRAVQRSALWALEQATGRSFGHDRAPWLAWFDQQSDWMRDAGQMAGHRLLACSDAEAVALIRELGQHPFFRHAISDMLAPVLFRESPAVVGAACATLARLGSPRAVGYLIEGLEHAEPECRALIHASLVGLTGRELPAEQAARSAALAIAAE